MTKPLLAILLLLPLSALAQTQVPHVFEDFEQICLHNSRMFASLMGLHVTCVAEVGRNFP